MSCTSTNQPASKKSSSSRTGKFCGSLIQQQLLYRWALTVTQPSLGGFIRGVSTDLEIQARQTKRVKEMGARILAENCGKTMEQVMKDFDRDYWMDPEEAVKYGIVDKIITQL